jgi:predicted flap endonuclease-1-like 5' DNA nuclease
MDTLYTYLLLGIAAGCALGGVVGWWLRKQGEAARQHAVEVYYREALKISESARDRARQEVDELGDRLRQAKVEAEARANELEELQTFLDGVQQAGADTTQRIHELEEERKQLRSMVKEGESTLQRLTREWKTREAQLSAKGNGHGELQRVRAELQAMTEARTASSAEADRLRSRVRALEEELQEASRVPSNGNRTQTTVAEGNGAPSWLISAANDDQDDLKVIRGLGPVLERGLNNLGVFYYRQVARMTPEDVEWLAPRLKIHPKRILRDDWASQARECHRLKYEEEP